ncbi:hypothetical protein Q4Q35_00675 [Flavivirga aquimarina]|uniref:Carbohydrate-binding module family 96 domain-containing protein n=1 Tax=Flavivirga aquimarina TaxID=2027862 RepID=A0ABT8W5B6_9FLAO|nr:hypothetical protein [Flavivirga aquimarina]MDO5968308.1 hypothetical protein [Flavivirga aquimarina]
MNTETITGTIFVTSLSIISFGQSSIAHPSIGIYTEKANPNQSFYLHIVLKIKHTVSEASERSVLLKFSKSSVTWNSIPSIKPSFAYGSKDGSAYYIDVTDYISSQLSSSSSVFTFKLFTISTINSTITFTSNETSNWGNRSQLQYYSSKYLDTPLYNIHDTTSIGIYSRGNYYTRDVLKSRNEVNTIYQCRGDPNNILILPVFSYRKNCKNT